MIGCGRSMNQKSDENFEASRNKYAIIEIRKSFIYQVEVIKVTTLTIFIEKQFLLMKHA